ncbi:MAG: DUF1801 domain-containing protein [Candidatus Saccharimonadaceae bacterium]
MSKADERNDISVNEYITSISDELVKADAKVLLSTMQKITGEDPILYGIGTVGFGVYKYEYTSGRKGDAHILSFYPRKGKTTIYLMDGTTRYAKPLSKLGKHTITGYCIYVKKLSDIDLPILTEILEASYKNITTKAKNGPIDRILWQTEK